MKRLLLIPILAMLNGCPGNADRLDLGQWRTMIIDTERVCYTVNKQDILSSYYLETNEQRESVILLSSGRGKILNLSYPSTCFDVEIKQGNQYEAFYTLNGVKHYYRFIVDNNGSVIGLQGAH